MITKKTRQPSAHSFIVPPSLCTYEMVFPHLPIFRSRQQLLYLSRSNRFPKYFRPLGGGTVALWRKNDLLAFWKEHFQRDWPHLVEAMIAAFAPDGSKREAKKARKPKKAEDQGDAEIS